MLSVVQRSFSISGSFPARIPSFHPVSPLKFGPIRSFGNWPPEVYKNFYEQNSVKVEEPSKKVMEAVEKYLPKPIREAPQKVKILEKHPIPPEEKNEIVSDALDTFADFF